MENITIVGAGSWGCALARILGDNGHNVLLYDIDKDAVDEINTYHTNKNKLHDGILPLTVTATTSLEKAIQSNDYILLVVPTAVVRDVLKNINKVINGKKIFINASKGIEPDTFKRVSQIVYEEINDDYIEGFVALTGPSHAEEVVMQKLTVIAAASENIDLAKKVQVMFSNHSNFRVYALNDLVGAELGGSLKNIYALASGICEGLGFGVNARAAMISRALVEMKRLCLAMGAKEETLYGLTGVGDLIVTCTSNLSRNYQAGVMIGSGKNLEEALSKMTMVVEGARTCLSAYHAARHYNVYTPIIDATYDVVYNHVEPLKAISKLMATSLKMEE